MPLLKVNWVQYFYEKEHPVIAIIKISQQNCLLNLYLLNLRTSKTITEYVSYSLLTLCQRSAKYST